jgi:hypothetical protein
MERIVCLVCKDGASLTAVTLDRFALPTATGTEMRARAATTRATWMLGFIGVQWSVKGVRVNSSSECYNIVGDLTGTANTIGAGALRVHGIVDDCLYILAWMLCSSEGANAIASHVCTVYMYAANCVES